MPYPPISALPPTPSRNAPSTFSSLMDAFLAAFPQFRTEVNALAAYLDTLALATGPGLFGNGSAPAPSISFASDTNTGFYRISADVIGFAVGGVEIARITSTGLQITGTISGTGVTQSTLDRTIGRLAKVGDPGIGVAVALVDATALHERDLTPGNYSYSAGMTQGGPESAAWPHALQVIEVATGTTGSTRRRMWISARVTDDLTTARAWIGYNTGAGAIVWTRLMAGNSLVGTVSQTAGLPTGAAMERGANANGEYVRFADGTQICWMGAVLSASIAANTYSEATWTYPAAFVATGLQVMPNTRSFNDAAGREAATRYLQGVGGINSTSSGYIGCLNTHTSAISARIDGLAIGRWF